MYGVLHRRMTYPWYSGSTRGRIEAERKAEALLVVFVEFVFLAPLDLH